MTDMIVCKSKAELKTMREANLMVARVLAHLEKMIRPGATTRQLDQASEELILKMGGRPAFKGYHGYPAALCASVNDEIVHGIPSDRKLVEGDITRKLDGCYALDPVEGDADRTLVTYHLEVDLRVPLPGFVKRRAEARVVGTALRALRTHLEA